MPIQNYRAAYIIDVVNELREAEGRLAKEEILRKAMENTPYFKDFLKATYNPHVRYHIRKIPEYRANKRGGYYEIKKVFAMGLLNPLIERTKSGGEAVKHLQALLEDLDPKDAQALELLISRDIKAGVQTGTINKISPGLIPEYPCMLCCKFDDTTVEKIQFPAISQIKMDGLRANLLVYKNRVEVKGRSGKDLGLENVFEGISKFGFDYVLDGEILVVDENGKYLPRKQSNGIINKCAQGTASKEQMKMVRFVVWDFIPLDVFINESEHQVSYTDRWEGLKLMVDILKKNGVNTIDLVETREVGSIGAAKEHFQNAIERKLEGTILKNKDSHWINGRSREQLKLKLENEADLVITGLVEGRGKYVGKLGAIVCESKDGLLKVAVGTGLSDPQREEFWNQRDSLKGKIIAVKYNERINDNAGNESLFLPVFIEIRSDKTEADALKDIA